MKTLGVILATVVVVLILSITYVPSIRLAFNEYVFRLERIDQETDYENRKMVEDTARSMISNYEFAVSEYNTYKDYCGVDEDKCQRALDAKTSANKTATTYNNYILKNKYLWKDNLPSDIYYELELVEVSE
jgi:hypothetical protein